METPEGLPEGSDAQPAEPTDQDGKKICPIGDPDLPENLTEPVLVPVASPNGSQGQLENKRRMSNRFFFN